MPTSATKPNKKQFNKRVQAAIADEQLATALGRALPEFSRRRARSFAGRDFQADREKVRRLKQDALNRLPELVEQFTREAEAIGAVVHLAETREDACRIVTEIAGRRGAKLAVKSKSMVSEEIHLNHALEAAGLKVVETDLGEWVIQLAGETPSHLIAPMVHKTREQVAELFSTETGQDIPADVSVLVKVARERLRQAFIDADIGISGANIAIAESGTLVLVSNEGNGRLVTTLPPVHVAIVGIEKIVPTLEDATAILRVLSRSATGQKLTSYVSYITGPSRTADIELTLATGVHGPEEVHIVLLDNSRWAAREDPELREALQCIRCGACSNVCPPYQVVGGHVFGHIYTGPIGLIMTAMHHGLEHAAGPQSLCVSCNACEVVCPAEIPIAQLILNVRARATEQFGLPKIKELAISKWSEPASGQRWARLAGQAAGMVSGDDGLIHKLPLMGEATDGRALTPPAKRPLREQLRRNGFPSAPRLASSQAAGLRVAFFPGCLIDRMIPEMGEAALRVLNACGCEAGFPERQHCCGLVALNVGDRDNGRRMARQTIEVLERVDADWVLTTSTSCYGAMAQDYQRLFADDPEWRARAEAQAARLIEFSSFLVNVAMLDARDFLPRSNGWRPVVTLHDSCQSANVLGLGQEVRTLVRDVLGLELREMADSSVCCGFGGSFSMDYPRLSNTILGKKLANIEAVGAGIVVSDNPGCLMQIRGGLVARRSRVQVMHVSQLVEAFLDG